MDIFEQQKRYEELAKETSESLAYFYCCIAFDVPFDRNAVPAVNIEDKWIAYTDYLRIHNLDVVKGVRQGFLDGLTDITKIFGEGLKNGEFTKAIFNERSARDRKQGTVAQRKAWGMGDEKSNYTSQDYDRLDELFKSYSSRLVSSGGYDTQQEYILRLCSRMSLDMEKMLASGQIDKAQKLNKMIQDNLASENLRKKDEKPIEDLRVDSLVDALEKSGLYKNGKILALPDLQKALLERMGALGGKPSHKYPYTFDAADQMILAIANTMRMNDGLTEMEELPDNMRFDENVAAEFAAVPNEEEKKVYEAEGYIRMQKPKKET